MFKGTAIQTFSHQSRRNLRIYTQLIFTFNPSLIRITILLPSYCTIYLSSPVEQSSHPLDLDSLKRNLIQVNKDSWPPDGIFSSQRLFSLFGLQTPAMYYYLTQLKKERLKTHICVSIFKNILSACTIITAEGFKFSILCPTITGQRRSLVKNLHWYRADLTCILEVLCLFF